MLSSHKKPTGSGTTDLVSSRRLLRGAITGTTDLISRRLLGDGIVVVLDRTCVISGEKEKKMMHQTM